VVGRARVDCRAMTPPGAAGRWRSGYFRPGLEALCVRNSKEKTILETVCVIGKKPLVSKNAGMRMKPSTVSTGISPVLKHSNFPSGGAADHQTWGFVRV